jgi:GldM N-terminal domain
MKWTIIFSAIVLFFCSCSNNSGSSLAVYKAAEEGLSGSTTTIATSNEVLYTSFASKLNNPQYCDKTPEWYPKAIAIKDISESASHYINELKQALKNEAGLSKMLTSESYNEKDITAVNKLLDIKGKELFDKLIEYRENILSVDSLIRDQFKYNLVVASGGFDFKTKSYQEFVKTFFNNIPAIAAMVVLSKIENNIRVNENKIITYCYNNTGMLCCGFSEKIEPLITQSTSYVKGGEYIEIMAGVGYYTSRANPEISINGKNIKNEYGGFVTYNLKTSVALGKHFIPVKMEFTKPDGTKTTMTKNIEYTVIHPNQNLQ